ncbi:MAG: hypothetical protein ABH850_00330 [Candidatus Micrarchaeota archaeon]
MWKKMNNKNPKIKITEEEKNILVTENPNKDQIEKFKQEIRNYDPEYRLFELRSPKIKKRNYLTNEDFFDICMWKSARQKNRYLKACQNKNIVEITKKAFAKINDIDKLTELTENLDGVGIPTASAILAVYNPTKYGVIDIRALQVLHSAKLINSDNPSNKKNWVEYIKIIRVLAKRYNCSPREVDKALFLIHTKYTKEKNLYKID